LSSDEIKSCPDDFLFQDMGEGQVVKSLVYQSDFFIVLGALHGKTVDITEGLKDGGTVVLNSTLPSDVIELGSPLRVRLGGAGPSEAVQAHNRQRGIGDAGPT